MATKEQIAALIAAKIAGQGSAVDVGGALPAILNGIIDIIPEGGGGGGAGTYAEVFQILHPNYTYSLEQLIEDGYTSEVLEGIRTGEIIGLKMNGGYYPFVFHSFQEGGYDIPNTTNFGIIINGQTRIITIGYEGTAKDYGDRYASVYGIPNPEWSFSDFEDNGFSEEVVKDIFNGAVQGFDVRLSYRIRHIKILSAELYDSAYTFRFYYNQAIAVVTVDFDNETATVTTESSGGGGSVGSLCYSIGSIPVSGTSQEIEEVFGQIFTDFEDNDYADESYPKFILCEDTDENNKYLIPLQISADIDGYGLPVPGTISFVYKGRNYRVIKGLDYNEEPEYRITSSPVPGYVGPIALEEEPNADWANITTVAGLTAVGITDSEVLQASRGFRTGLTFVDNTDASVFIPLESASREDGGSFGISFKVASSRYSISYDESTDEVTVSITSV